MSTFIFNAVDSSLSSQVRSDEDTPDAIAISAAEIAPRAAAMNLTCLCLIRRKKGKTVAMRLLLRHYASE